MEKGVRAEKALAGAHEINLSALPYATNKGQAAWKVTAESVLLQ
jgi:hypothetical protein